MLREFRILIPYLARYRGAYVLGTLCILAGIGLKLWIPRWLGEAIDDLRQSFVAGVPAEESAAAVGRTALWIVGTAAAVAVIRTCSRLLTLGTSRRVAHDLRNVLFDHLLRLAPAFFVRNPTGQVMSRCINDMQNVQGLMGPVILYLAETLVLFVFGLAMMFRIDPLLTAAGLLPFPFFLVFARKLAVEIQEGSRAAQNSLAEVSAKVDESLSGQLVIKTLAIEDADRARFVEHCERYRHLNLEVTRARALLIPLMMGLVALSTVLVLALGGPRVAAGALSLGDIVALMMYLQLLASPTRTLGFVISSLRRGASALGRVREILEAEPELSDPARPARLEGSAALRVSVRDLTVTYPPLAEQPHLSGSLPAGLEHEAEGAELDPGRNEDDSRGTEPSPEGTERHSDRARTVLDGVSFEVEPGTTLGIVGHTGAGKTTLVRALARQLAVPPNTILHDGRDVTELGLEEVRSATGYVPQDAWLFSATLADNVALGRPDAERAQIEAAVRAARLDEDLAQLQDGLDTLVGERGVRLSGGQRQRAAIARVLLLDPRLVLLDDALSAVDSDTADRILGELKSFAAGRTTIVVAHRLATVRHADRVLVLEEGRIVEDGTHDELLALDGRYARMWYEQERADGLPATEEGA